MSLASVLLPAPVGPTSATRSPTPTLRVTPDSTGRPGTYSNPAWSTTTSPRAGSSTAFGASSTSGTVSRMPYNFCSAAPADCTE